MYRVISLVSAVTAAGLSCPNSLSAYQIGAYTGMAVNFLLPESQFFRSIMQRATEFSDCTGLNVVFKDKDLYTSMDGWSLASKAVLDDLGHESCIDGICTMVEGAGLYDVFLVKSGWVPSFTETDVIRVLNQPIAGSVVLEWNDIFPAVRNSMSTYNGNIVSMPFDADFAALLVRGDLLEMYETEIGQPMEFDTWQDLAKFIEHWDGKDLNGDGIIDTGACHLDCLNYDNWGFMALGGPFYAILASILQTQGPTQGIFFDLETFDPLFDQPSFELAVSILRNISTPCPLNCTKLFESSGALARFKAGRCAATLAHPGPANGVVLSKMQKANSSGDIVWEPTVEGTYVGPVRKLAPGSTLVLDRSLSPPQLVTSSVENSPYAKCKVSGVCVNRSPLISGGNTVIFKLSDDAEKSRAVFELVEYMNAPAQSTDDASTAGTWNNHWRRKHVAPAAWPAHKANSWTAVQFNELRQVTENSLEMKSNPSLDLRIPGYHSYIYDKENGFEIMMLRLLGYQKKDVKGCVQAQTTSISVAEFVVEASAQFNKVSGSYGRLGQLLRYRKSLQQPPLSLELMCKHFKSDMADEGYNPSKCDEKVVEEDEKWANIILVVAFVIAIFVVLGCMVGSCIRVTQNYQRLRTQARQSYEAKLKRIEYAKDTLQILGFSMCFINFTKFRDHGSLLRHEVAREMGSLVWSDTYDEANEFVEKFMTLFISHQWLGFVDPDLDGAHHRATCGAVMQLCEMMNIASSELYLWVDYTCVPQRNVTMQTNAIASLPAYASLARYFICLAPPAMHLERAIICDQDSYKSRGWCRLEQWAKLSAGGLEDMYLYDGKGLMQIADMPDWTAQAISVLAGDFTVENDKEKLVDVVLGMYMRSVSAKDDIYDLIEREGKSNVFPEEYFQDLIHIVDLIHTVVAPVTPDGVPSVKLRLLDHIQSWPSLRQFSGNDDKGTASSEDKGTASSQPKDKCAISSQPKDHGATSSQPEDRGAASSQCAPVELFSIVSTSI